MKGTFTVLFLFSFLSIVAQAPNFYVQTDAKKIVEGSYLTVKFILENVEGGNFSPPSFKGFNVLSGPSQASSMSIVNGQVSRKLSYEYAIQPKAKGKIIVGPASIKTNAGTLTTESFTVEVIKGNENKNKSGEEIFITAEISDSLAYVGQQLILNYKLYTKLDVRSIDFLVDPEFDGFFTEELRNERRNYNREIIDGVEYYTKSVKKVSLFPQQTGTYNVDPIPVNVGIATDNSQRGFFSSMRLKNRRLQANGITIKINNTPTTSKSFSGAIGKYKMVASTPKRSLTTDEAIIVNMQITGNGDNKAVMAPHWPSSDSLEVYDPNVLEDQVFTTRGEITHRKTFEYLMVPKVPGRYNVNPEFTYFDTDSNAYVTLRQKLPIVNVIKGKNVAPVIKKEETASLAPNYTSTKFKSQASNSFGAMLPYFLLAFLALGSLGIFMYENKLEKSGKRDPALIRKQKASSVAIQRLETAQRLKSDNNSKSFHEEIVVALKKYLSDKYNIPALHIQKNELLDALNTQGLSELSISEIKSIIDQAELAIYAPGSSTQMEGIYNQAVKVISELEA